MKCIHCGSEFGEITQVFVATVNKKLSPITGQGFELHDKAGNAVAWISELQAVCKNCRPSHIYTNINWSIVPCTPQA